MEEGGGELEGDANEGHLLCETVGSTRTRQYLLSADSSSSYRLSWHSPGVKRFKTNPGENTTIRKSRLELFNDADFWNSGKLNYGSQFFFFGPLLFQFIIHTF